MEFNYQKKQNSVADTLKKLTKHPFFGIIVVALIFVIIQVLANPGILRVPIKGSTVKTISGILIYVIVGLGMSILLGYAGLASLGTAGFIGLTAYTFAILYKPKAGAFGDFKGISAGNAILIALLLSLILGVVIGFISLRIEGMYLAIITLGVSEILAEIFAKWVSVTGGHTPYSIFSINFLGMTFKQTSSNQQLFYITVGIMALVMIFMVNMIASPTGRAMLAMKNSTSAAQAMGVSIVKYRLMAFVLATLLAGLGGVLYFLSSGITSAGTWNLSLSLNILAAVVIGGMKSIYGVLVGTFLVFGLNDLIFRNIAIFKKYTSLYLIINGLLIILMVMFYPGGIVQLFVDGKNFVSKKFIQLKNKIKEYRYGKDESN